MKNNNTPPIAYDRVLGNVFSLFTGFDGLRQWMSKPFEQDGFIYATDSMVLIRISKSIINEVFDSIEKPICQSIIPSSNCSELISVNNIDFEQYKTENELIESVDEKECGLCDGSGKMTESYYHNGKYYEATFDCPVCDGTGYEERSRMIPSGKLTFNSSIRIRIKDNLFDLKRFYKLVEVKQLINCDIYLIHNPSDLHGALFKVGDFEILLMPTSANESDCEAVLNIA